MLRRFMVFCFTGFIAIATSTGRADPYTFPSKLEGKWEQVGNDERGNVQIIITKKEGDTIYGIMTLTGSTYCKDPIPFQGAGGGSTARISGDAPIICGYRGELSGEVARVSDEVYKGNFTYRWFGITWAKGTFQLTPVKE